MSGALAAAAATLFADPNLSAAVTLRRPGQPAVTVRAIRRDAIEEGPVAGAQTISTGATFELLRSACPVQPEVDSVVTAADGDWSVFEVNANARKGTWLLSCQAA